MLGRVLALDETVASLLLTIMAYIAGRLEDSGLDSSDIAYLSSSIAGFMVALWSVYHLFGYGAARKDMISTDDGIFNRRASIDMLHSPALI